jgi:predicted nucleic acid-binding protein
VARVVVADASVWVSRLVTDDVFHTASRRWLTQHAQDGGQWVAPALMPAEVVGAISRRTGALSDPLALPHIRSRGETQSNGTGYHFT